MAYTIRTVIDDRAVKQYLSDLPPKLKQDVLNSSLKQVAAMMVNEARNLAPSDTGELRRSISAEVDQRVDVDFGYRITSPLKYAGFVEKGTGVFNGSGPFFPPPRALQGWAVRHGFPQKGGGFLVARAIFRNGGVAAQPYLKPAFEKYKDRILPITQASLVRIVGRR